MYFFYEMRYRYDSILLTPQYKFVSVLVRKESAPFKKKDILSHFSYQDDFRDDYFDN